ncbi:hypothetical protein DCPSUM001_20660 [Dysgonomonas capnocytophagoides]|nr:hypothetical protein DCPSUM001_20660 [Dysgonomonas capnocytophagoides]
MSIPLMTFFYLVGIDNLSDFGQKLMKTTARGSGIPVLLSIAPNRMLAKLANRFAKKYLA